MQPTEFIDAVFQIIKAHEQPDGLKASKLGQLVHQAFPNEPRKSFGFQTLKDVLAPLEQRGLIRTGEDRDKAFAVWLTGESNQSSIAVVAPTKKYNPLKSEIWLAFVSSKPLGKRFMHRTDGTVRMGLVESPHPADQWVEIAYISVEEQKTWAKKFAAASTADPQQLINSLDGPNWFVEFAKALRSVDSNLAREWNKTRTEKVSACVAKWCEQHKIELATVFRQRAPRDLSTTIPPNTGGVPRPHPTKEVRELILSALSRMSTHELSQLQIPAHYLLQEMGL